MAGLLNVRRDDERGIHFSFSQVFKMIGTHASSFAHWAIPALWGLATLAFVLSFICRRRGRLIWAFPVVGVILALIASAWMVSAARSQADTQASAGGAGQKPSATEKLSPESQAVFNIVVDRCQACHSNHATLMPFAAYGLSLNTMKDVDANASPIYKEVVQLQQMPMGNMTHMTDAERATIARWYASKHLEKPGQQNQRAE